MNQKQGKRHTRKKGYYTQQFNRTAANKSRRATKRRKKAEHWANVKADKAASVNAVIGRA